MKSAYRWGVFVLSLCAIASLAMGIKHSLEQSLDFQQPAAVILWNHQDPWIISLAVQKTGQIATYQGHLFTPNYLHELYVVLWPLTLLSFYHAAMLWCAMNLVFLAGIAWLLGKIFALSPRSTLLIVLLLVAGVPFRASLAVGQLSFFEMMMLLGVYYWGSSVMLGLSYSKYSFSPVLALVWLAKGRVKKIALSMIPVLLGVAVCMIILHVSIYPLLIEPLQVAKEGVAPGFADVMTIMERLRLSFIPIFVLGLAALYAIRISLLKSLPMNIELVLIVISTLLLFKHLIYDYIFLVIPLARAISLEKKARAVVFGVVGYFWFATSFIGNAKTVTQPLALLVFNCLLMIVLLFFFDKTVSQS